MITPPILTPGTVNTAHCKYHQRRHPPPFQQATATQGQSRYQPLNILGCCSVPGGDGKQRLSTGCIESDIGTANIKNKADTDFERWKAGAPEQAEVRCFLSETSQHTTLLIQKQEGPSFLKAIQK